MRLSFVIPNYNGRRDLVFRAVHSLLKQTKPVYEILFVDDGSSDQSFFEELAQLSPLVKLFLRPHLGPGAARQYAIENANGTHVAFLDGDDVVSPFFAETAERVIVMDPDTDILLFGVSDKVTETSAHLDDLERYHGDQAKEFLNRANWQNSGLEIRSACGKVYSLSFLRSNDIKFPNLYQGEDVVMNFKASLMVSTILVLSSFFAYGYFVDGSSSSRFFNVAKRQQFKDEAISLFRLIEQYRVPKKKAQEAYYDIVCEIIPITLKTFFCHPMNKMSFWKRFRDFRCYLNEESVFVLSIRKIDVDFCPTKKKRAAVRLHKLGLHLLLFFYYERKLRWKK